MIRLTRSQLQPIGLDLGLDAVKMIQIEVVDGGLAVVAAAKHILPEEVRGQPELHLPAAMDVVRQLLKSGQFSGRQVVTCVPREMVVVKNLRLPVMPTTELESAVNYEARHIFPFDTNEAIVRHLATGEVRQGGDTKLEVITLAVQHQQIDFFIEQLHRSSCLIESLDFEPCAIYRSIERFIRRREDESEVHVLVDVGARQTQVVIGKGREISFFKPIEIGSRRLHQDVARKLGITDEEARGLRRRLIESAGGVGASEGQDSVRQAVQDATRSTVEELAREVSLCLRYYSVTFRGQRPRKVRLLGGEASDPQLLAILGGALPIPVEPGRPLNSIDTSRIKQSDRHGTMSEWSVALGLALKQTREYFGARDGKRRELSAPSAAASPSDVEVIDLGQAVAGSASAVRPVGKEAAHA